MDKKVDKQEVMAELRANQVFQEMVTQLRARLKAKRKEQRSALLQSDNMAVFRLEAEASCVEEALKIYDAHLIDKKEIPTVNY